MAKKQTRNDDMRPEYKCSDFGEMERGKYVAFAQEALKIAFLRPEIASTSETVRHTLATSPAVVSEPERVAAPPKRARKAP